VVLEVQAGRALPAIPSCPVRVQQRALALPWSADRDRCTAIMQQTANCFLDWVATHAAVLNAVEW